MTEQTQTEDRPQDAETAEGAQAEDAVTADPAAADAAAADDASDDEQVDPLEQEGDIAADYLEELLDIADLDGDLDMDVDGDRAAVSIVGADLGHLVGGKGEVLDALQELPVWPCTGRPVSGPV